MVEIAFVPVGNRAIVECVGKGRPEPERLIEILYCVVVLRFEPVGDAPIVVRGREPVDQLTPGLDHCGTTLNRGVRKAQVLT
jgi:hypothetical protein